MYLINCLMNTYTYGTHASGVARISYEEGHETKRK